ncbi:MAG: energy transducer TonB, partial [Alphaproteobacteria bacterium]
AEPSPVAPESPPAAPVVAQAPAQESAPPVFARPSPEQRDRYFAELKAWLERHKRYPLDARRAHIQGTTTLYFVIDRAGRVIDFRIDRSSGFSVLDREVTAMVARAGRLPPMPDSLPGGTIALSLPVQFRLR